MNPKTILELVTKLLPTLWKNILFKHVIFIGIVLTLLNFGKDHQPVNTLVAFFQDSNTAQLKLILKQTEQERDEYKQKEAALNIEFSKLVKQKKALSIAKKSLQNKIVTLEKEIQGLLTTPVIQPSANKNELAKQFTDLGFEAMVKECTK